MASSFFHTLDRMATPLGWMLIYLLTAQGTLPGLVLCFGDKGHVAVETPHRPFDHSTSQSQKPCLDVPLLNASRDEHPLVTVPSPTRQDLLPEQAVAPSTSPLFSAVIAPDVLPSLRLLPNPPVTSCRTVILRI